MKAEKYRSLEENEVEKLLIPEKLVWTMNEPEKSQFRKQLPENTQ